MINNVSLMGRLTRDPELRRTKTDKAVVDLTLAVDRSMSDGTDFIRCTAWNKTAEFIDRYFHKGDMLAGIGSIVTDSYTNKNGDKVNTVTVNFSQVSFCGSKRESGNNQYQPPEFTEETGDDGELPF